MSTLLHRMTAFIFYHKFGKQTMSRFSILFLLKWISIPSHLHKLEKRYLLQIQIELM